MHRLRIAALLLCALIGLSSVALPRADRRVSAPLAAKLMAVLDSIPDPTKSGAVGKMARAA